MNNSDDNIIDDRKQDETESDERKKEEEENWLDSFHRIAAKRKHIGDIFVVTLYEILEALLFKKHIGVNCNN